MGNPILFLIVAVIAVGASVSMIVSKNAVHSALFLILNFAAIAVFYLLLNAPFIAMVQITIVVFCRSYTSHDCLAATTA